MAPQIRRTQVPAPRTLRHQYAMLAPTTPVGLAVGSLCTLAEFEGQSAVSNPINAMNRKTQQALASSQSAALPADRGVEGRAEPPEGAVEDLFRAMMWGNIGIQGEFW